MASVISPEQVWSVVLTYSSGFIQLASPDQTQVRRIQADELPGAWSFFNTTEQKLLDDLEFYNSGSVVKLNSRQLGLFKEMYDRAEKARVEWEKQQEKKAEEPEIKLEAAAEEVSAKTLSATASESERKAYTPGIDQAETRINSLTAAVQQANDGFFMLIYDIPVVKNRECPNPSHIFWRYGFRLNDSCWIFTSKGLSAQPIQSELALWNHHNIETFVVQYHESGVKKIREKALQKLEEEIRRLHTSLIETIGNADEQLKAALTAEDVTNASADAASKKRDGAVRQRINLAAESLDAAISCAEHFDMKEKVADLLQGLRLAVRSQALTFNSMARKKQIKPVKHVP